MSERPDEEGLSREVGEIWDRNAEYWDLHMGEGNAFHSELVQPSQERLLDLRAGDLVLDVACGNGQFARQMARLGARVVAFDSSARMIELARGRTSDDTGQIEYSVLDATDEEAIDALGKERFDAAVCTMAMMDMPAIEPMVAALRRVLKPGGRFVFSVGHPCFNSEATTMLAEDVVSEGRRITQYSVRISEYIRPATHRGEAMRGQPALQYYFRASAQPTVQELLRRRIRAGRPRGTGVQRAGTDGASHLAEPRPDSSCPRRANALTASLTRLALGWT